MKMTLLGGISPTHFLRHYWQKKPLLVREAIPGFGGLLTRDELINLACGDEAQSRLVIQKNGKWQVRTGPFTAHAFSRLSSKNWSVLVQDVNHFLPSARELLLKFSFIPYARMDDLMVSYAPEGGGVGPHFDSYDVFLLQGTGRRLWQISAQQDKRLEAGAPLKILHDFRPEQEWLLEPGDMLYLPPGYAHHGVAKDACMTYSVGFRAADHQELATQFLVYLQDNIVIDGIYSDPHLHLQPHPGRINREMLHQIRMALNKIKWSEHDVERFTGMYLTEPKPHVFFTPPSDPVSPREFDFCVRKGSLRLNLKSRMLCSEKNIFLNGDIYTAGKTAHQLSQQLADRFILQDVEEFDGETLALLYQWYTYGYVELELDGGVTSDSPMFA
jgi:50S ribosomal protein L16 3-hydroxylase